MSTRIYCFITNHSTVNHILGRHLGSLICELEKLIEKIKDKFKKLTKAMEDNVRRS